MNVREIFDQQQPNKPTRVLKRRDAQQQLIQLYLQRMTRSITIAVGRYKNAELESGLAEENRRLGTQAENYIVVD